MLPKCFEISQTRKYYKQNDVCQISNMPNFNLSCSYSEVFRTATQISETTRIFC